MKTKSLASTLLVICMLLSLSVPALAANSFTDVPDTHWGYTAIERAAEQGLVNGTGNNKYTPDATMAKTEWLTMICNLMYKDTVARYNANNTYANWYDVSVEVGKSFLSSHMDTKPFQDTFGAPTLRATRYVMAATIYAIAKSEGWDSNITQAQIDSAKSNIADWDSVPEAYRQSVAYCYAAKFITGVDSKGTFDGSGTMTRAAAAVVLCRLLDAK